MQHIKSAPAINGGMASILTPILDPESALLASLVYQLETSQWWSAEQLQHNQYRQLRSLASYAYEQSPYFRAAMDKAGLTPPMLTGPEMLARLPVMTRRMVREAGESLYCKAAPQSHHPVADAKTSGSTGEPVCVRRTGVTNLYWQAHMMRNHFWCKRDFSKSLLTIRSIENQKLTRQDNWGRPVSMLFPSGTILAVPVLFDISQQVKRILAFKPSNLLLYPNNLKAIIKYCKRNAISIGGIEHVICIGETVPAGLREEVLEFFGVPVEDNYSSQEVGIMAIECPESGSYHVMSESVILEVLDAKGQPCKPGQVGKIVVTDLQNFATPMVRYEVGDYAEVAAPCSCGRGLPTLTAIRGRERNLIAKPGGVFHWPRLNFDEYEHALLITRYQIVQHALDDVEVRLVMDGRLSAQQEAGLIKHLQTNMDYNVPIRFTYFEHDFPPAPSGKFEEFISHVCSVE